VDRPRLSLPRLLLVLYPPFLLVGLGSYAIEAQIERGTATPAAFGLLVSLFNLLLLPLANRLEGMAIGVGQRPWLSGRLRRWQRLILPYSTASVLTIGFGLGFGGSAYLIGAPSGAHAMNVVAALLCATGGTLLGFGLSRLAAGILIVRSSGLWAASRRSWWLGGGGVTIASLAFGAHTFLTTMSLTSVV